MRGPLPPGMFPRAPMPLPQHMGYLPPRHLCDSFPPGPPPRPSPPGSEQPPNQSPSPHDVIWSSHLTLSSCRLFSASCCCAQGVFPLICNHSSLVVIYFVLVETCLKEQAWQRIQHIPLVILQRGSWCLCFRYSASVQPFWTCRESVKSQWDCLIGL